MSFEVAKRSYGPVEQSEIWKKLVVLDEPLLLHLSSAEPYSTFVDSEFRPDFLRVRASLSAGVVEIFETHFTEDQNIERVQYGLSPYPSCHMR